MEVRAVAGLAPDPRRVAVVLLDEVRAAHSRRPLRHVAGEPVEGGPLAEGRVERLGVHRRDPLRVEAADPLAQLERSGERLLERDLLVEDEADEKGERVLDEEPVRGRITGEGQSSVVVIA